MNPVFYHNDSGRAWVTIDNPPVNATSQAVRAGLIEAIASAERDNCRTGVIVCLGRTFVAGGDISEFGKPPQEPHLPDVYWQLEQSPVIWAVALHGTVLGGGFELAMAAHVRVATSGTRFGLPEVNLGLVPGAGGTQRLPRLVGAELAADLASSGRMIDAQTLFDAGGLDAVVEDDLEGYIGKLLDSASSHPLTTSERNILPVADDYFTSLASAVDKKAKGAKAPQLNIDAVKWAMETDFIEGQSRERQLHLALRDSEQSIALRHAFFAERLVSKPAAIKEVTAAKVEHITVVGGGLMGAGISAACLAAGLNVHLIEVDDNAVAAANERVKGLLQGALKRGKITQAGFEAQYNAFSCGDDYRAAANTDIAIEAVFEDMQVKQNVFAELARHIRADAILATNTSYLNPEEISTDIKNPQRVVGLHFFSPAHIMKLLEIVDTKETSAQALATAFSLAKRIKKVAVLSGVCDGFIGNRMLAAYRRQGDYLLADGATPQQIDAAMRAYGMPMGPYELQDLTGLQIGWANRKRQAPTRAATERYVTIADQLCEKERFGQRSGSGWYQYESDRKPVVDQEVEQLIQHYSNQNGIQRRTFTQQEIQNSMIAVLANEGARILEEGIAERALDIDMVKIHGYGFPRWRGGPMHTADVMGDDTVATILASVVKQSPGSWLLAKKYQR